jgi:hypothetical protein
MKIYHGSSTSHTQQHIMETFIYINKYIIKAARYRLTVIEKSLAISSTSQQRDGRYVENPEREKNDSIKESLI